MTETDEKERLAEPHPEGAKIWSGKSFLQYHDYREVLGELPISAVAIPTGKYDRKLQGNLEYVYGELAYSLTGYEGYLRDKAFPLEECFIKPVSRPSTFILEFDLAYKTKDGEARTRSWEVLRPGETQFILFLDYYRPL